MELLRLTRPVDRTECRWLPRDLDAGAVVVRFRGPTYGCISPDGTAVNLDESREFFELPTAALEPVGVR